MARFLYFTDLHYSTTPPAGRIDDYGEAIRCKLEEIVALAQKGKATLLFGGDMFHKKPGGVMMGEVADLVRILKPAAPIYGILGNHDISGHQVKTAERSAIGILIEAGILVLVDEPQMVDGVMIAGCSYHPDYETPKSYGKGFEPFEGGPVIWLSHGILVDDDTKYPYQVTRDIDVGNLDGALLLNGHVHTPWMLGKGQERILNPGSIGRVARPEMHQPMVVGISVAKDGAISHKAVAVKSAREAFEVFGDKEDASKLDDDGIEAFARALQAESGDLGQTELLAAVERACGSDKKLRQAVGARLGI
jgi:DNA repair exonuclease SbcCD nuclease subunit